MKNEKIIQSVLKAVALAMGIAVIVLSYMNAIDSHSAISMLAIGIICLSFIQFSKKDK